MSDHVPEDLYGKLGVSSGKEDVHSALRGTKIEELFPGSFCKVVSDISKDPDYAIIQHQDGAGSKVLQAYIHYKETGDADWFRGLVYDTIAMNLDDILCVGITEPAVFTDTIDRNPKTIPGEVIAVLIDEFNKACKRLNEQGVEILFGGGETADLGDQVATLTLNGTITVRFKRSDAITGQKIKEGDVIVGLASGGKANYEDKLNSGISSNGLTLARHALMSKEYAERYPETVESSKLKEDVAYFGPYKFDDKTEGLEMTVGEAILSPTRTYAPVVKKILNVHRADVHGMVHNTGGGQTKCLHLGNNIHYIKDNLFEPDTIFSLIQKSANESWENMFKTFNCGSRLDIICDKNSADSIIGIAETFNVKARQIGRCERSDTGNKLTVKSKFGEFSYGKKEI